MSEEERLLSMEAVRLVQRESLTSYADLVFRVLDGGNADLYDWVTTHTLFLGELCESVGKERE